MVPTIFGDVTYLADGTYGVTYTPEIKGFYTVAVADHAPQQPHSSRDYAVAVAHNAPQLWQTPGGNLNPKP